MLTTQKTKLDFILYPTLKAFSFRLLVQKRSKGFLQNQELTQHFKAHSSRAASCSYAVKGIDV